MRPTTVSYTHLYFFHLGGKFHVFRSDADTFVVMTDKDRYQEMVKSVEGRFSEEWKIEENHILLDHTCLLYTSWHEQCSDHRPWSDVWCH